MIFTNDIYRYIGDALIFDGYRDIREISIDVLEEKIDEFLRMKLYESDEGLDTITLLQRLQGFLENQHNKEQVMANFTFYLLHFMSILQGFSITWRIEDVNTPYLEESDFAPGKIDSLVTSRDIDYIYTFKFVLEEIKKLKGRGR